MKPTRQSTHDAHAPFNLENELMELDDDRIQLHFNFNGSGNLDNNVLTWTAERLFLVLET